MNYYLGTAPFCDPNPNACEKLPGYYPAESSSCGDGSCCWTGSKIKCQFDKEKWKQTPLYRNITREVKDEDFIPEYQWFGNAPACDADNCDVYESGFIPFRRDKSGDGTSCLIGEKIAGFRAVTPAQKRMAEEQSKRCSKKKIQQQKTIQKGLEFGTKVAETAAAFV